MTASWSPPACVLWRGVWCVELLRGRWLCGPPAPWAPSGPRCHHKAQVSREQGGREAEQEEWTRSQGRSPDQACFANWEAPEPGLMEPGAEAHTSLWWVSSLSVMGGFGYRQFHCALFPKLKASYLLGSLHADDSAPTWELCQRCFEAKGRMQPGLPGTSPLQVCVQVRVRQLHP